jgi:hypothetical protein
MGIHSLPARRWGRIGLVALLGLTLALVTLTASNANGSVWRDAGATVAKKKCKKKHKSAATAKKKKCKKKKHPVVTPPAPQPRGPITRLDVTWPGDADIDAHAWSSGLHDGWNEPLDHYEVEIPGTTYTGSFQTPNHETIVETNPNPSIRPLTFGLCYYPFSGDHGETDVTVTTVFASGESSTTVIPMFFDDALVTQDTGGNPIEGGDPDPVDDWCPQP